MTLSEREERNMHITDDSVGPLGQKGCNKDVRLIKPAEGQNEERETEQIAKRKTQSKRARQTTLKENEWKLCVH